MKWIIAFLIFSLLVLFHEFGHFLVARLNGVAVEEFSLGYGPRLLSFVKGGTRYSLKILLFGGSCRMKGMLPEWAEDGSISDTPPEEGSFLAASPGRRAAIVFAGPLFNFILAFLGALIVISVVGYDPALVTHVTEDSHAYEAGLRQGDLVTSFMGHRVSIGRDIDTWFLFDDLQEGQPVTVTYERDGQKQSISYIPDSVRRYMLGLTYNADDSEAVINAVSVKSPLESAGVRAGDVITAVNGEPVATGEALFQYFADHPMDGSAVNLSLSRGGRAWETEVTPVYTDDVRLGFAYNLGRVRTTPVRTVLYGLIEVRYWIVSTVKSVGSLFTGRFSVNDLSGPVGVADVVGTTYEQAKKEGPLMTWMNMINLVILLSANLGVMNLLPIPALDGGRLLFILIEAVRGKPVNQNVEAALQTAVALLLIVLMVYIFYHDLTMLLPH